MWSRESAWSNLGMEKSRLPYSVSPKENRSAISRKGAMVRAKQCMPLSGLYLICGSSPLKTKVIPVPLIQCPVGYAEIAKVIPFKEFPVCNFFKGVRQRQTDGKVL